MLKMSRAVSAELHPIALRPTSIASFSIFASPRQEALRAKIRDLTDQRKYDAAISLAEVARDTAFWGTDRKLAQGAMIYALKQADSNKMPSVPTVNISPAKNT